MKPAFSSNRGFLGFVLLVLTLLTLPVLTEAVFHPRVGSLLESTSENAGHFGFISDQIYRASGDIDILFIGSSFLTGAIDTAYVRDRLASRLARPASVLTFAVNWRDEQVYLLLLTELLRRRQVRMVVMDMPKDAMRGEPHPYSYQFFTFGSLRMQSRGLPWHTRLPRFAETVLGGPRLLWRMIHPSRSAKRDHDDIGSSLQRMGWGRTEFKALDDSVFTEFTAEEATYSQATAAGFDFHGPPLLPSQSYPLRELKATLARHDVQLVIVHTPTFSQRADTRAHERAFWPAFFGAHVPVIGIPESRLLAAYDEAALRMLFYNEHMNENGGRLFTRAVTPALLEAYERFAASR